MAEGGRDQPETEVEELRRRLRETELLRDENEELKRQLTALSERHDEDMARLQRQQPVVNVKVAAPTLLPRLKTFTGLAPTGGSEVAFLEWENQAEQVLSDTGVSDPLQTLRSTLRGLALDQVRHCTRVEDLVHRLRHTFGEVKAPDDLYLDFCGLTMNKKELPSEFLLRLWSRLLQINRTTMFSESELRIKLYRAFVRALGQSHSILSVEIRGEFGFPGSAGPQLDDLLRSVRRLEEAMPPPRSATTHTLQQLHQLDENALVERLVARVTERLEDVLPLPVRRSGMVFRGRCYNCGQQGDHFARDCPHPPQGYARENQQRRQPSQQQNQPRRQHPPRQQQQQQSGQRRPEALNRDQPLERSSRWRPQ